MDEGYISSTHTLPNLEQLFHHSSTMQFTILQIIFRSVIFFSLVQALALASQQRQPTSPPEVDSIKFRDSIKDPPQPVTCSVANNEDLTSDSNSHGVLHRRVVRRPIRRCEIDVQHGYTSSHLPAREYETVDPIHRRSTYDTYLQHHVQIEIHDPMLLGQ